LEDNGTLKPLLTAHPKNNITLRLIAVDLPSSSFYPSTLFDAWGAHVAETNSDLFAHFEQVIHDR
jgi:hypothetical protein